MPITFATATHTGLVRRGNEDAFFARPPVFAVADGMGGAQAGEVASAMAVGGFQYFLPQTAEPDKELASLIARANQEIFGFASSGSGREGMGTTITAAVISGGRVALGHVGDSRAWLLRDGELKRLTEDHSLVAEMVREGQLSEEEAAGHPQRSVITRALGVDADVQVDTDLVDWRPGDVFLLASDGLHGLVPEDRIREILAGSGSLARAARELVEAANAGGGNDNVTVVLFNPDGSVPGEEESPSEETAVMAAPGEELAATAPAPAGQTAAPHPARRPGLRGWFTTIPGLVTLALLGAAVILAAAWYSTRFAYYVGIEGDRVSIYQGIPYDLGPLPLSSLSRSSPVYFRDMEPYWQERVAKHEIQSKSGAETMLSNIIAAENERKAAAEQRLREAEEQARNQQPPGNLGALP